MRAATARSRSDPRQAMGAVFYRHPQPGVLRRSAAAHEVGHPPGALGEDLKSVLRGIRDHPENFADVVIGNPFVKQVAHGVYKIDGRLLPAQRLFKPLGEQSEGKSALIPIYTHRL